MPFYPLKKISALAENRQAYLRGVSGYNAGWVEEYKAEVNAFYPEYITARVQEADAAFHVEIGFDESEAPEYLDCDCGRFHPEQGACKHMVAVLVHKYYRNMIEGLPTAAQLAARQTGFATDAAALQLIDRYMAEGVRRITARAAAQVTLTPVLDLTGPRPSVSFTVGAERPYRIKNLYRFANWMQGGERVAYGKELELLHHPDSFAPASRPMLAFLLGELAERQAAPTALSSGGSSRLVLGPAAFDRLFSLLREETVLLREGDGERPVHLCEGYPTLTVTAEKQGDGVRLHSESVSLFAGPDTLYMLHGDVLYRTGAVYARCMREWLQAAGRTADGLYIAAAQLFDFCGSVLDAVRPYINLEGEESLRAYASPAMQAEVWLDAPAPDTVTARLVCRYGNHTVEPYGEDDCSVSFRRDTLGELEVRLAVERLFPARHEESGLPMRQGDDDSLYALITEGVAALRRVAAVRTTPAFDRFTPIAPPTVRVGVSLLDDLLEMALETQDVSAEELAGILDGYRENRTYHRLPDGRFVQLDEGMLAGLAELADSLGLSSRELRSGRLSLPKYRALYLERLLRAQPSVSRDAAFEGLVERCRRAAEQTWPVPESLRPVLRGYQTEGYRWLRTMEEIGFGGILADDMGLGKTLQVITLFLAAKEAGEIIPSLVVCPTSVVLGWEQEMARFAPSLRVLCVIGDAARRQELLQQAEDYDVLVTSYDMLKRDVDAYTSLRFRYHVLDEAQYIKNSRTQNARAVKTIRSVQRLALTGTPMENRLSELWSIFDFLMPGFLFSYARFRRRFEQPIVRGEDERAPERLARLVSPFILRRLKRQVLAELPPKTERVLPATMERPQWQVYADTLAALRRQLLEAGSRLSGQDRISVLAMLTRLRQLCCDPRLCCEGYTGDSCKLETCVELLREATAGGHKVLLFSQFTSMLALIRERLQKEGISHYVLQGSTSKEERARLVEAFNTDDTSVFLISLKAGGTGLNLTGADMVIHYDPWWNLAAQNQATDRAHRIGQVNPVQVVQLIAKDTVEEKILQMQQSKWQLAETVVGVGGPALTELTPAELLELLD